MHEAQGGRLLRNFRKRLGSTPSLHRRSIVVRGKWKSLLCGLKKSYCSGERCRGEQTVLTSSSVRHLVAESYSEAELGIQPMSGLEGDCKCSRVIVVSLPLLSVTTKRNTSASSIAIDLTRTICGPTINCTEQSLALFKQFLLDISGQSRGAAPITAMANVRVREACETTTVSKICCSMYGLGDQR